MGEKVIHRVESGHEGILISVDYNDINEEPIIETQRYQVSYVKNGTSIVLTWNEQACFEIEEETKFFTLLHSYAILNPHLKVIGDFLEASKSLTVVVSNPQAKSNGVLPIHR